MTPVLRKERGMLFADDDPWISIAQNLQRSMLILLLQFCELLELCGECCESLVAHKFSNTH
jgi:hypothetical protein